MGIGPREPKWASLHGACTFGECVQIACIKMVTAELMGVLGGQWCHGGGGGAHGFISTHSIH